MSRMTVKRTDGRWALATPNGGRPLDQIPKAVDRLAAYENSGFAPEEFMEMTETIHTSNERFKPFIDADGSGRLVIIPYQTKDLHDNEAICSVCNGTGLRFDGKSFGFCHNCYNGIVRFCEHCGKQIPRLARVCDCDFYARQREKEFDRMRKQELENAEKHPASALGERFQMACSDYYPYNDGYFSDWGDFFDAWNDEHADVTPRPEYVWGTDEAKMRMDACDIVEHAVEDMYEDAIHDIGDAAIHDLQVILDAWIKENGVTSYTEAHRHAIKIPWEDNDNE